MTPFDTVRPRHFCRVWLCVALFVSLIPITSARAAMLYKDYVIRYDRGWDILCDPYQIQRGDWVLKIFRQKGEIAHEDFREFLGIFQRLNPHVKDIDRIRPGQVVDIPLKKLAQGHLPGQSSGVVTIPFVMINTPDKVIKKHTNSYTVKRGDTVSTLIARQFGGRYGDDTYQRGLALFKAANPQIEDINRIYAGQKIYMPDPSIREQSWYAGLFDSQGKLVEKMGPDDTDQKQNDAPRAPLPTAAPAAPSTPVDQPPEEGTTGPAADAAAVVGGRLLAKGTYYLPMRQGPEFELDLSRFPMIDMQNGTKVVLTESDRVMETDIASVRSYWDDVKAAQIPENATAEQIIRAVLEALGQDDEANDQLAFNEGGVSISVTAKWIRSRAVNGGVRHICITPISQSGQQTHWAIRRYLDQNDIDIKEILPSGPMPATPQQGMGQPVMETAIDGSSQKAAVASFARLMGFRYSPQHDDQFPLRRHPGRRHVEHALFWQWARSAHRFW